MDTTQLKKLMMSDPCIRPYAAGVHSADHLLGITPRYPSCMIANTDPSDKPGMHWVAFYYTHDHKCEFFDSHAMTPDVYHPDWVTWISQHATEWTSNKQNVQPWNTSTCGLHCLFFLYHRCLGLSFAELMAFYSDNLQANDLMVELDLENHFREDIVYDTETDNSVPAQLCLAFTECLCMQTMAK